MQPWRLRLIAGVLYKCSSCAATGCKGTVTRLFPSPLAGLDVVRETIATRLTDCVARECMCDFIHFSKVVMPENIHTQVCSAV